MIHTAGRWDPSERQLSFLASGAVSSLDRACPHHPYLLIAINELGGQDLGVLQSLCQRGARLIVDSGIFALCSQHARVHGLSHDQALRLAPEAIDGFGTLLERYCQVLEVLGDTVWGYIELDQGGAAAKRVTRAMLEARGLRPMPVYHPLLDGWEYFDELAQGYDRICFGNVVQADPRIRRILLATAWQRKQQYPHLWIHMLGMTASELLNAYPIDSCDSSTWLSYVRWPQGTRWRTALKAVSAMPLDFRYVLEGGLDGADAAYGKAWALGGYEAAHNQRCWHGLVQAYAQLGSRACTDAPAPRPSRSLEVIQ